MKRFKPVSLLVAAALAIAGAMPAHSQPLTVAAGGAESAFAGLGRYTVVANQVTGGQNWNLGVYSAFGADNVAGPPNATADFTANGSFSSCTYIPTYACTNWTAQTQNISATAYQADPLGNSATFKAKLLDTANVLHDINITFTRPTATSPGYNPPNAWVDVSTNTVQVTAPLIGIQRSGYIINGVIDGIPVLNANSCSPSGTCGYSYGSTWFQVGPAPVTING